MLGHAPQTMKVDKPWGRFEQYSHNQQSMVKLITVNPGERLSSQYHFKRDELWVALDPGARVELRGRIHYPKPEEKVFIPRQTIHRLSTAGDRPVRVLEICFGKRHLRPGTVA